MLTVTAPTTPALDRLRDAVDRGQVHHARWSHILDKEDVTLPGVKLVDLEALLEALTQASAAKVPEGEV